MDGIQRYISRSSVCRWCVQVRCIGDNDKEGIGQWLSWQFNNLDFRLVLSFAGGVVAEMAAKAFNVIEKSSSGMNECVYQVVKGQVGILLWWLETKQSIVYYRCYRSEEEVEVLPYISY